MFILGMNMKESEQKWKRKKDNCIPVEKERKQKLEKVGETEELKRSKMKNETCLKFLGK